MPAILSTKDKAVEDARKTQAAILDECSATGNVPPPYTLTELIGKGSFGRVYKAAATDRDKIVAVKIISIEEGDSQAPGQADVFNDILKEVNTLKLLNDSGAKNINAVVDTLLIGQSVWMVTEYCAGGSVATLMRPTKGLPEACIIPILREVAEAIRWVHGQSIIHRDLKCANVLVHEDGQVQLIDFGVAGVIESKVDKRTTVTGTLQWMAPELFDSSVAYGTEVDIWAYGSMAYEMATGLPPNATTLIDIANFGSYLKRNSPRLQGDHFSANLKKIVSFCMVPDPAKRPPIEAVQKHAYIANTEEEYPTESLAKLVHAYKLWERQGGNRQSLFSAGGAQGVADEDASDNIEWDFGDGDDNTLGLDETDFQVVYSVYGPRISMQAKPLKGRRRQPPQMKRLQVPLEKVFDPKTPTTYEDHARVFYGRDLPPPPPPLPPLPPLPPASKFPQRSDSLRSTARHSLIDLGVANRSAARKSLLNPKNPATSAGRESLIDLDESIPSTSTSRYSLTSFGPSIPSAGRESLIDLDESMPSTTRHSMINFDDSFSAVARDSLIDLDASTHGIKLSKDFDTIRGAPRFVPEQPLESKARRTQDWTFAQEAKARRTQDWTFAQEAKARRTQDWTFAFAKSTSADTDTSDLASSASDSSNQGVYIGNQTAKKEVDRTSALSMIDLDESIVESGPARNREMDRGSALSMIDLNESIVESGPVRNRDMDRASALSMIDLDDCFVNTETIRKGEVDRMSALSMIDLDESIVESGPVRNREMDRGSALSMIDLDDSIVDSDAAGRREADRTSALSMIDLDDSVVDVTDNVLPFTTGFDGLPAGSNLFDYSSEEEISPRQPGVRLWDRKQSMYVPDDMEAYLQWAESNSEESNSPNSSRDGSRFIHDERLHMARTDAINKPLPSPSDALNKPLPPPPAPPPVPLLPSASVMTGSGSPEEVKAEMHRLVSSMREQLQFATDVLGRLEVRRGFPPPAHTAINIR